jgi:hypothetical protein
VAADSGGTLKSDYEENIGGMVSGLFEKKRDAIPPHSATPQALVTLYVHYTYVIYCMLFLYIVFYLISCFVGSLITALSCNGFGVWVVCSLYSAYYY